MKDMKDDTMELIIDYVNFPPGSREYYTFSPYGEVWPRVYKYNNSYLVVEYYNYEEWDEATWSGSHCYGVTIVDLITMAELDLPFSEDEFLDAEDIEKILEKGITDDWHTHDYEDSITEWSKEMQEFYLTYIKEHYENTGL